LIVAQCTGTSTQEIVDAFFDELPEPARGGYDEELGEPAEIDPVRGFFDRAQWTLEQRDLLELDPDVLFRLAPACKDLWLQDVTDFDAVGARIRRFDVVHLAGTHIDNAAGRRLAAARGFGHLQELTFDRRWLDDATLTAIYDTLPALERIDINERNLDFLRPTTCARSLRTLRFSGAGTRHVLDLRGFSALRDVNANHCILDGTVADLPNRFHALELWHCDLTADFRAVLNETHVFSKLRALSMGNNTNQHVALVGLLASPHCGPLRSLAVHDFDVHVAQALQNVANSLEQLDVVDTHAVEAYSIDAGEDARRFRALARIPFTCLAWLALRQPITPSAARALATAPWLRTLREFTLDVSKLDDDAGAAAALAAALGPECRKVLLGDSYEEIFDAFGIASEEIVGR
jgi:hypothetical protein